MPIDLGEFASIGDAVVIDPSVAPMEIASVIPADQVLEDTGDPPDDDPEPAPQGETTTNKWVGPILTGALLIMLAWALTQEVEHTYSRT